MVTRYGEVGVWSSDEANNMFVYQSIKDFPNDLRRQYGIEPEQKEFFGDEGRHYHVVVIPDHKNVYLVAEVSEKLLIRPMRDGLVKLSLTVCISMIVLSVLLSWFIGRRFSKPLNQLATLVDKTSAEELPNDFAKAFPKNEIGLLASTLEDAFKQLDESIAREKSFTRDVSHELRNPLMTIKSTVELMKQKQCDSNIQSSLVGIENAALSMEQTVYTLLNIARSENVKAKTELANLLPIVEEAVINFSHLLDGKDVEVVVSEQLNQKRLIQKECFKILVDNLISNAFQYTTSGKVEITLEADTFIVSDTGPGISHNMQEKHTFGYGFGLSIVKRLCDAMGWRLSMSEDTGTSISVCLKQ
jgi:signal transduction histidine kinase